MAYQRNRVPPANGPVAGLQQSYGPTTSDLGGGLWDRTYNNEMQFRQHQAETDAAQPVSSENIQLSLAHRQEPVQAIQNPMWSKFYAAMNEHAPGGVRPSSGHGDPMAGMPNSPFSAPSTMWQGGQSSAVTGATYGQPGVGPQAVAGLKKRGGM